VCLTSIGKILRLIETILNIMMVVSAQNDALGGNEGYQECSSTFNNKKNPVEVTRFLSCGNRTRTCVRRLADMSQTSLYFQ